MKSSSPFVGLLKIGLKWVSKLLLILSLLASSLFLTNYTTHIDNGCFKLFLRVKRLYKNTKKKKKNLANNWNMCLVSKVITKVLSDDMGGKLKWVN